jgi:hypothetical protein
MSNKHPKPGGNKPHPQPHQASGEHNQCKWDGNAKVSGEIGVRLEPNFVTQHESEQKDAESHNDKTELIGWLTLFAVVVYAGLTGWQGWETRTLVKTAQDTYNAIDRPYIGVSGAFAFLERRDENGKTTRVGEEDRTSANTMSFSFQVKNYGSVPAVNTVTRLDVRINGVPIPGTHFSDAGSEMFPGEEFQIGGIAGYEVYPSIALGKSIFQVNVHTTYEYAGRSYDNCERQQYVPDVATFIELGPICDQPWAKGQ